MTEARLDHHHEVVENRRHLADNVDPALKERTRDRIVHDLNSHNFIAALLLGLAVIPRGSSILGHVPSPPEWFLYRPQLKGGNSKCAPTATLNVTTESMEFLVKLPANGATETSCKQALP